MLIDYLKTLPQFLLPKKALTCFAGLMANVQIPAVKKVLISWFIEKYKVNMAEALEENPENYSCFNDFFIRHLKPECRPLAKAEIVSPVDGCISELGQIEEGQILQAKGRYYTVDELLASEPEMSQQFKHGRFATLYLSPKDYHRIHMPLEATLREMTHVPGKLFSVQPTTARIIPHLFARNERLVTFFDTQYGLMAMVLVGATIVGAIGTRWQGDIKRAAGKQKLELGAIKPADRCLQQGEEMGYFKLGSTVVLLFAESERLNWLDNLSAGTPIRYGQAIADVAALSS